MLPTKPEPRARRPRALEDRLRVAERARLRPLREAADEHGEPPEPLLDEVVVVAPPGVPGDERGNTARAVAVVGARVRLAEAHDAPRPDRVSSQSRLFRASGRSARKAISPSSRTREERRVPVVLDAERLVGARDAHDVEPQGPRLRTDAAIQGCPLLALLVYAPALVHAAQMLGAESETVNQRWVKRCIRYSGLASAGVLPPRRVRWRRRQRQRDGRQQQQRDGRQRDGRRQRVRRQPHADRERRLLPVAERPTSTAPSSPSSKSTTPAAWASEPPAPLARSSKVKEYAGTGNPQISCFDAGSYPDKPGTPQTVTVKGTAVIFSHGCSSSNLTIEFHKVKRGGADDGDIGDLVGTAIVTNADCSVSGVASVEETCNPSRSSACTSTPASRPRRSSSSRRAAHSGPSLLDYNIFIRNDQVVAGEWTHDVRALAADDYGVISQAAIGAPITAGHGAIAGEVHDCGDVRLQNALVDVTSSRKALTSFGDDKAHPLPDLSGKGTSTLGLYAAIDLAAGPVAIAAAGKDKNGKMVGLGFLGVHVYPDAVTAVTFRGMNPILVP